MNKRINELAEQAGFVFWSDESWGPGEGNIDWACDYTQEFKKFAELIVRECMSTVLKESKWYWDKDEFESSNAIQNAARRVKEHFGVEE